MGVVQYSLSQKQPFRRPFADLSRAFTRSIFLRYATVLCLIDLLDAWKFCWGPIWSAGLNNYILSKRV